MCQRKEGTYPLLLPLLATTAREVSKMCTEFGRLVGREQIFFSSLISAWKMISCWVFFTFPRGNHLIQKRVHPFLVSMSVPL